MHAWRGGGVAVLWLVSGVFATECSFMELRQSTYPKNYTGSVPNDTYVPIQISSQEDLNNRSAGCTTIIGDVSVGNNYTGSLVLHNVINITGDIGISNTGFSSHGLTSIEMPDLVVVNGIYIAIAQPLELISFPKLISSTSYLIFDTGSRPTNISFPALVNTTSLRIVGNTSALNFDSLRNAFDYIEIRSSIYDEWNEASVEPSPPRSLSFPSLQHTGGLTLTGNISSVNVPLLETVRALYNTPMDSGFNVANSGKALEVTAPLLSNTTSVSLSGGIGAFSFPSLLHLDGDLTVNINSHVNVSIVPLQTASNVFLTGNITGYDVSSLKDITYELEIKSTLAFIDCTQAQAVWANLTHDVVITNGNSPKSQPAFACSGTPIYKYTYPERKKQLSTAAKTGIGLGVGMAVVILLAMLQYHHEHKKMVRRKTLSPLAYDHELQETNRRESEDAAGDVLPGYQPRGAPGVVAVEEGAVVGTEGIIPEPDPPGYDTHARETASRELEEPRPVLEAQRAE